jgi:lipoprotein-anchoring transpeptidase ErfK/SrfK
VRTWSFIGVAALLLVLVAGAAGVYAYDNARETRIAEGVTVSGVDVGGLGRVEARDKLRDELMRPLSGPVVVRAGGERFRLTAREARIAADIDGMVREAVARSRQGNILTRTLRNLTGGEVNAALEPDVTFSSEAVGRLVSRVRRHVNRDPRDARLSFSATGFERVRGRDGLRVDRDDLRTRVERALLRPGEEQRIVTATVRRVPPEVTTRELARRYGTVLIVDRTNFRLRLYKDLELDRTYPIALGQAGNDTPSGLYDIQNKAVNPAWNVPNSDWAGDLAGQVIPGGAPNNPLRARWLGIYDGVGIHGTSERGSIGSNASRGCIRMLVEDVIDLYPRVPVGAPIYIS